MTETGKNDDDTVISRLWPLGKRSRALERERRRMEALLGAVPVAYCGWGRDGVQTSTPDFARLLGVPKVTDIADIESALTPGDAAALAGLFQRLQSQGQGFDLTVSTADGKRTLRMIGGHGVDQSGTETFDVLWAVDVTEMADAAIKAASALEKTRAREQELRAALDNLPFPVWIRREDLSLSWCNRAYSRAIDVSPATVVAEQRELPVTPTEKKKKPVAAARKGSLDMARRAIGDKAPVTESRHAVIDGDRRLLEISEIPVPAEKMVLGCAHDITGAEEMEAHLRRYQTTTAQVLEHLGTAISIWGGDTRLEFYNSAFADLWRLDETWLNARPRMTELLEKLRENRRLPEQADFKRFKQGWLDKFTSLLETQEDMIHLPDGTALRVVITPHPMGGLLVTWEDVTSRLALESSYNTLIAVQRETLDNLSEGLAVFGGDGRLKLWNPAYAKIWGLEPRMLEEEPHVTAVVDALVKRFEADDWTGIREEMIACALERTERTGRMRCTDGMLVQYTTVPLPDGAVLNTFVDITDSIRVENALREKNAALEEAERLKLDFLANVSYQLRTPLNAMMGFAEILNKEYFGPLNERQKEYAAGMMDAGHRLISLINDILDLSTIEAGYLSLYREEVDIRGIIQNVVKLTEGWARKQDLEIKTRIARNTGSVIADERRIKQVLLNLIRNAINFTQAGGKITIATKRLTDGVAITVSDSGVGIPEEDQDRIFAPFERVQGQPRRGGAGLGLSLVQRIIELHGGTISIQSTPGKGTAMTFTLPFEAKVAEQTDLSGKKVALSPAQKA